MMRSVHVRYGLYGLLFGFILSRMGFADFVEVHRMFVFDDLRLFLAFAVGVALSMAGFLLFSKLSKMPPRPLHPGTVIGGVLFGIGWAVTGACPAIVLVQLGEGQVAALATLVGLGVGVLVYPPIHRRYFRWDVGSCSM